ncbi:MAG: tetratricopeptide repeat protein [Candidatus Goldiibacteriota bacterium]
MADATVEIEELKKKLSQNPESMIFVPLADAYRKAGMLDDAIKVCEDGLEKHPSYTSARVVLGRIYSEKGMLDEAIEELKRVEAVDVDNIMVHSMLGNVYLKKKMYARAIEQFQRVLSLNPEDSEVQEKLQEALSAKQAPEIKEKEKPSPEKPEPEKPAEKPVQEKKETGGGRPGFDAGKNMKIAELYTKKEEFAKAIEIYKEILDSDSDNMTAQQRLREVYALQDKKLARQKQKEQSAGQAAPLKKIDTDKITAEDILDVMKEAVEDDSVDEEKENAADSDSAPVKAEEHRKPDSKKVEKPAEPEQKTEQKQEPKPEPKPEKEKEASEKTEDVTQKAKDSIETVLKEITDVDGMIGSFFLLRDATIVASVLPASFNAGEISRTITAIVEKTEMSVMNMKQGKVNQVVISSESGQLLFTEISKGVLFLIGDENINVGKMGLMLKNIIPRIKEVL